MLAMTLLVAGANRRSLWDRRPQPLAGPLSDGVQQRMRLPQKELSPRRLISLRRAAAIRRARDPGRTKAGLVMTLGDIGTIASIVSFVVMLGGLLGTARGRAILSALVAWVGAPALGFRMHRLGVYEFYDSRTALFRGKSSRVFDYLQMAKSEIGIIAVSLNYSIMHQDLDRDLELHLRSNSNLRVRILLLKPDSEIIRSVARVTGRSEESLTQYIGQSLARLEAMRRNLGADERQRFELYTYDAFVSNSIVAVDPTEPRGRFLVENYLYRVSIHERYCFECRRRSSVMYQKVLTAYTEFLKDATRV